MSEISSKKVTKKSSEKRNAPKKSTKKLITVKRAVEEYFCGCITTAMVYDLIRRGELPATKVGRRVLLDVDALKKQFDLETIGNKYAT